VLLRRHDKEPEREHSVDQRFSFDEDELRIDDLVFRLGYRLASDAWKTPHEDHFLLFKPRPLLEKFDEFFAARPDFHPRNIFEIGIWDGGSTVFWSEYFQPDKLVAIDWLQRQDSEYFQRYVRSRGAQDRVRTCWGVDQGDAEGLREIVGREFAEPLDLVLDDGSHLPEETTTSFEILFPCLRVGGVYVIEDWNWELLPEFRDPGHVWASTDGLVGLVTDLARLTGSSQIVGSLTVCPNFVAVERGLGLPDDGELDLDAYVRSLPQKLAPRTESP
jgi:hypothetical protein